MILKHQSPKTLILQKKITHLSTPLHNFASMNTHNLYLRNRASTSLKWKFTKGFVCALIRINRSRRTSLSEPAPCSPREIFRRYKRVKDAADKSLACAVGSRRAWSRAMLRKIRNGRTQIRRRGRLVVVKRRKKNEVSKQRLRGTSSEDGPNDPANELAKLVPGGEYMDLCSLLDEAAHYLRCLNAQVQVMRRIADLLST